MEPVAKEIAKMIDHTILNADANDEQIRKKAHEAIEYGFYSLCVNPYWVSETSAILEGTGVKTVSVIGFPLGQGMGGTKHAEAEKAIEDGADEVDMVMNIGALKSQRFADVEADIRAVTELGATTKVIIETCYLLPEEKVMACEIAKKAGADFIKTSTGFGTYGATTDDVSHIRTIIGPDMGIKAAGGISSWEDAVAMIHAGATRIGSSRSIDILRGH